MSADGIWRGIAIAMCIALPAGFYVAGDLADAFPGVLTIDGGDEGATARPRAVGEDYERVAPSPLIPASATGVDAAAAQDLQARLDAHAADPVVAGNLAFSVVDAETGEVLAQRDAQTARTPASTLKLLTATAVMRTHDADDTLATTTVLDGGTLTLVGGGDMRLTEESLGRLADLAAARVRDSGGAPVALRLDDTLFDGGINPAWGSNGPDGGWVAPTAALAVDEGWLDADEYGRKSPDPAMDAANLFSRLLTERGVTVTGSVERAPAPEGGQRDEIRSAPLSDLVEHTLLTSDNTTAEVLGRLVAIARGEEATPEGAARAVQAEITDLAAEKGIVADGLDLKDVCGLAVDDRVPPALLAGVVAELDAAGTSADQRELLSSVPIAGLTGTLEERFTDPEDALGRGLVRGKTGYLGGTSTLVGIAALPDGRPVAFSIVVHSFEPSSGVEAKAAVDAIATEIVSGR